MKKLITIITVFILAVAYNGASAQCVINNADLTPGFSPSTLPCIGQNASYGQTVQIYVPSSAGVATIDSIQVTGVTGLPVGITATVNPASGSIIGGGWGCIWFSGSTIDTVGTYPLTFLGTAYTSFGPLPLDQQPVSALFSYSLSVCSPEAVSVCDTIFNLLSPLDTPEIYVFGGYQGYLGYWSGNNTYGDIAKAEQFSAPVGAHVNGGSLAFGYTTINPADSNNTVTVYAWDNSGPGGSPGLAFDSAKVTLKDIANEVTAVYTYLQVFTIPVSFNASYTLTDTAFYIGVVLPTTTGDTIALFTNSYYPGIDGKGWEEIAGNIWAPYDTDYGVTFGNFISADVCGDVPTVGFMASPTTGCGTVIAQFTNTSAYNPTSLLWTFSNGSPSSSTAANPSVTYSTAGSYNVKLVVSNIFGADSATITSYINVYASPSDTLVSLTPATGAAVADGSITINAIDGTPPYTYIWNNQDTGATISHLLPGQYVPTVTDMNGCATKGDTVTVTFINGIAELSNNTQVKIYPNPASDQLNIQWSVTPDAEISIIDMNGKTTAKFIANGSLLSTYDIHNLSSGAYVIRITDLKTNQQQSVVFNKL